MAEDKETQDVDYFVTNDFDNAYLEISDTEIYPKEAKGIPGSSDVTIRAVSNLSNRSVDCRVGFDSNDKVNFRLTVKRKGGRWTLKKFARQEDDLEAVPRDTENPKVDVKVEPDGQ